MLTVDVVNEKNSKTGQVNLPERIFAEAENKALLHEATVLWQRSRRAGTVSTKGRSQVSGGGRKPWKQKGTGRARVGSSRSPLWVGGGVIHGPKPRDFECDMPKRKRKAALRAALSLQYRAGNILVLDGLDLEKPSTSKVAAVLKAIDAAGSSALIVAPAGGQVIEMSARNIEGVMAVAPEGLNPYLVLYHRKVILLKETLPRIEEIFG